MKYGQLVIEKKEMETLKRIISSIPNRIDDSYKISIKNIMEELKSAKRVAEDEMPDDIVRFNSKVTILDSLAVERTYKIVTPEQSNISKNMISILAPMGLALFGYSLNDKVKWQFPNGIQTLKIIKIEQWQKNITQIQET